MLPDNQKLTELHMHLRGAIPVEFLEHQLQLYNPFALLDTAPTRYQKIFKKAPNIKDYLEAHSNNEGDVKTLFTYDSFDDFLATYLFTSLFIQTPHDFAGLIDGVCHALEEQNIVYAEITVSPIEYLSQTFSVEELIMELKEGASRTNVEINWIVDPVRNLGPERCCALLLELLGCSDSCFTGITLGGSEHLFPPEQFVNLYKVARKAGLRTTCHAGEALGPESVRAAIDLLEVERVGHGVRAIEDLDLVGELARREIPLEICVSGNIQTGIYPSIARHPIRQLLEAGVMVTVNTDDPTFFHTTLRQEYNKLFDAGFSEYEIKGLIANSAEAAFLTRAEKDSLLKDHLKL